MFSPVMITCSGLVGSMLVGILFGWSAWAKIIYGVNLWATVIALVITYGRLVNLLLAVGLLHNTVAVVANGGYMPVQGRIYSTTWWMPMTDTTRLPWLCDIWVSGSMSIGDLFIFASILVNLGVGLRNVILRA